ncbi:MAG: T9SS type A sorting domain-containing protein, partial [Bacteroidota bacterium]
NGMVRYSPYILVRREMEAVNVYLFPNPASDQIQVEGDDLSHLRIMDLSGRIVMEKTLTQSKIDISMLPAGTYIYEVVQQSGKSLKGKLVRRD